MLCTLSCTAKAYETRAVEPYCTTTGSLARGIVAGGLNARRCVWSAGYARAGYGGTLSRSGHRDADKAPLSNAIRQRQAGD
jgi:hypothetical protein